MRITRRNGAWNTCFTPPSSKCRGAHTRCDKPLSHHPSVGIEQLYPAAPMNCVMTALLVKHDAYFDSGISIFFRCIGRLCESFPAFSWSLSTSVYRYFEHRTLNLMPPFFCFLIVTCLASARRATSSRSLISLTCFGYRPYMFRKRVALKSAHAVVLELRAGAGVNAPL